jgi:SseB protein N-terminal domain
MSIASESDTDTVDRAVAAAVEDPARISELLDVLRTARLWLPLPDDGTPVVTGTAVTLPVVCYLGSDFVPAYSSADMLRRLTGTGGPAQAGVTVPHVVVRAADLARLLPPSVGIALNAGAPHSVPVYPQGVACLAEPEDSDPVSIGPLPPGPAGLLAAVGSALTAVPQVSHAAAAWLRVRFCGEGMVLSVALDDPADPAAKDAAIAAIEAAARHAGPGQAGFPIDATFPGEAGPDRIDDWFAAAAAPFYRREHGGHP